MLGKESIVLPSKLLDIFVFRRRGVIAIQGGFKKLSQANKQATFRPYDPSTTVLVWLLETPGQRSGSLCCPG